MTNSELRGTPLSGKKGDQLPREGETEERMDLLQNTREDEQRLLKKCGMVLRKMRAATIVQANISMDIKKGKGKLSSASSDTTIAKPKSTTTTILVRREKRIH